MVPVSRGEDESSCVLEEIKVGVFESCLQRPKDVIFEGLVMRVQLWWWWRKEEEEEEEERVERSWRSKKLRERMRVERK